MAQQAAEILCQQPVKPCLRHKDGSSTPASTRLGRLSI